MPKMKTNRAAAKRFKKTGGAKIKRGSANRRHILTSKPRSRKVRLRKTAYVERDTVKEVKRLLPYG